MRFFLYTPIFLFLFLVCIQCGESANSEQFFQKLDRKLETAVADQADLAEINRLIGEARQAYSHFVTAEALGSVGLLVSAEENFAAADKLSPDYVLNKFHAYLKTGDRRITLVYPYVHDHYLKDSGVQFFTGLLNLKKGNVSDAVNQLEQAAKSSKPWPGAAGRLGMVEYNKGNLQTALNYVNAELIANPGDLMARRVRILTLCRMGYRPDQLESDIRAVLRMTPNDDQMNLLLAQALLHRERYQEAMHPLMLGWMESVSPLTVKYGKVRIQTLIKKLGKSAVINEADKVCQERPLNDFRATLFRMRFGDLLESAGYGKDAIDQWNAAIGMNSFFKVPIAFKIGKQLMKQQRLPEALVLFDYAVRESPNDENYVLARDRVAHMMRNSWRDYSLQIKALPQLNPERAN